MALEKDKKDRSYQFGRLLAVLEKIERDTYDKDETREPNIIRVMATFRRHPDHTAALITEKIRMAYLPRLSPASRVFYQNLMQEIYHTIDECPQVKPNTALGDSYLMGYYLQRRELYLPKAQKEQEENK